MLVADYPEHNHKTFLTVYLCCVVNPKVRFQGFDDDSLYRAQVFDRDYDGDNDFYMNNDDANDDEEYESGEKEDDEGLDKLEDEGVLCDGEGVGTNPFELGLALEGKDC